MPDSKANEAARNLIKSVQETNKAIADTTITTQERNLAFAQNVLENGIEVLKSQVSVTHSLMQELGQQFQKQQDAFQALAQGSMDAYRDFIFAPLSFWQKALGAAESATLEGLKNFQKATEQGLETIQKTAHQAASTTEKAARHNQSGT